MNNFEKTGIYGIFNKINNKVYIGSTTVSFKYRYNGHKNELKNNTHHSITLQRAINKYGMNNFKFKIIEIVEEKENILNREQYWMEYYESYNPKKGYNISPTAGNYLGVKHTEETKKKMSNKHKGKNHHFYGKKFSDEHRIKISEGQKGKIVSDETRDKLSDVSSKVRKITLEEAFKVKELLLKNYNYQEISNMFNNKFSPRMVQRIRIGEHKFSKELGGKLENWRQNNDSFKTT